MRAGHSPHEDAQIGKEQVGAKLLSSDSSPELSVQDHLGPQLFFVPLLIFEHSICTRGPGEACSAWHGGSRSTGPGCPGRQDRHRDVCTLRKGGDGTRGTFCGTTQQLNGSL